MSLWESTKDNVKKGTKAVTSSLLGLMGATTSTGLVFYCAFKGAVICSGLGTLIPGLGNIAGFVVGAILGAGFAGALLLLVYKGLIVLDKKVNDGKSNFELNQEPNQNRALIRKIRNLIQPYKANRFTGLVRVNSNTSQLDQNKISIPKLRYSIKEKTISILKQFTLAKKNIDVKLEQIKTNLKQQNNTLEHQLEKLLVNPTLLPSEIIDDDEKENPPQLLLSNAPAKRKLSPWAKIKKSLKSKWESIRDYKNFFKYAGGVAAIGTVISCAYYGSMIGGTVGSAIPILGNIGGFIVGGILGAATAGVLVFLVGKGVVKLDNAITENKQNNPKIDLMSQLKKMRTEIATTKEQLNQLKIAAFEQINILHRTTEKNSAVRPSSVSADITSVQFTQPTLANNVEAIEKIPPDTINLQSTVGPIINNIPNTNNTAAKNKRFFTPFFNLYHSIKKPTLIIAGVPAAIVTILSCSYYGALMGTTLGTAVPGLGNLAGLIIGAILGAAVAGGLIYLAAKGLIALDKNICDENKTTQLINELDDTEREIITLKREVSELNHTIETKKQSYSNSSNSHIEQKSSIISPHEEIAITHAANPVTNNKKDDLQPLIAPSAKDENDKKGFFTAVKDFIVEKFEQIKSPILKFLGGTAGAITVGTCGYYGAMIGLSAGSIFPWPGNIFGGIVGAVVGALIGLCFVTITAKLSVAVYEKISHNHADTVNHKITTIENEVTKIEDNKNTLNNNLDEMRQIWEDTYNYTSDNIMSDRLNSGDLSDKSHAKEMGQRIIDRHAQNSAPASNIEKPFIAPIAPTLSQTLLPPPNKPAPRKYSPPLPPLPTSQQPLTGIFPGT